MEVSTIVEIIEAYQPQGAGNGNADGNLQQQKLLEHTSLLILFDIFCCIYNSRNYLSILAVLVADVKASRSTIVEIIGAYQPCSLDTVKRTRSTIVEIIGAYQPCRIAYAFLPVLSTIVEIIGAYQPCDLLFLF